MHNAILILIIIIIKLYVLESFYFIFSTMLVFFYKQTKNVFIINKEYNFQHYL